MRANADIMLLKRIAKGLVLLVLTVLVCRFTQGVGASLLVGVAILCAFTGRTGWSVLAYILFPAMMIMNPFVLPKTGEMGVFLRSGIVVMSFVLMLTAVQRKGNSRIPISGIWIYLLVAIVSSAGGYYPQISYLKIANFSLLMLGIGIGFSNIDKRVQDLAIVRIFLLTFVAFIVFGSYFVKIFMPGAAYLSTLRMAYNTGLGEANAVAQAATGKLLFAGITNQSQCLAIILPSSLALLVCDMLFVERRISKVHLAIILAGLPMVYMTGSRSAFLTTAVSCAVIYFYCLGKINISRRVRSSLRTVMTVGLLAIFVVCGVMEVKNDSISKWLRKSEDVAGDTRGFGEAFTASRQGLIAENMYDFKRNPILGSGFQVSYEHQFWFKNHKGMIWTAPIEKGVLPVMVLGETGIVGEIAFLIFLSIFYMTCIRKKYFCCMTLMTAFIVSNMAEANFFSPGGPGGMMWVLCVGGGFVIDMIALHRRRIERQLAELERMQAKGMVPIQGR